ncbi:hypothetical protein Bca52824_001106 [Brassica carinata]|uniref:Uncharacterized protein n=1 Tax=Brassica carinata TaxID=52824 RepID=A0A8X7WGR6_BRACI|nr:hypothetical protein Bca52824_001106 [Brassica carinata]
MSSRRKSSSKSHRDCFVSGGSSSHFSEAVPKVEFEIPSADPEEEEAYWKENCVVKASRPGIWNPRSFQSNPLEGCPSRSCPNERVPAQKSDDWFSNDKGVDIGDLDFSVDDFDLPGWDPNLAFGDGSCSSDMPLPDFDNFFDGLPANPDPPPFVEEPERPEIVAESSRAVNGVSSFPP